MHTQKIETKFISMTFIHVCWLLSQNPDLLSLPNHLNCFSFVSCILFLGIYPSFFFFFKIPAVYWLPTLSKIPWWNRDLIPQVHRWTRSTQLREDSNYQPIVSRVQRVHDPNHLTTVPLFFDIKKRTPSRPPIMKFSYLFSLMSFHPTSTHIESSI